MSGIFGNDGNFGKDGNGNEIDGMLKLGKLKVGKVTPGIVGKESDGSFGKDGSFGREGSFGIGKEMLGKENEGSDGAEGKCTPGILIAGKLIAGSFGSEGNFGKDGNFGIGKLIIGNGTVNFCVKTTLPVNCDETVTLTNALGITSPVLGVKPKAQVESTSTSPISAHPPLKSPH